MVWPQVPISVTSQHPESFGPLRSVCGVQATTRCNACCTCCAVHAVHEAVLVAAGEQVMEEFHHIVTKPWIERLERVDADTQKALDLDREVPPPSPACLCGPPPPLRNPPPAFCVLPLIPGASGL